MTKLCRLREQPVAILCVADHTRQILGLSGLSKQISRRAHDAESRPIKCLFLWQRLGRIGCRFAPLSSSAGKRERTGATQRMKVFYDFYPQAEAGSARTSERMTFETDEDAVLHAAELLSKHSEATSMVVFQKGRFVELVWADAHRPLPLTTAAVAATPPVEPSPSQTKTRAHKKRDLP